MISLRARRRLAGAALALALAGGGAAVNLRLIEGHRQRAEPLALVLTDTTAPGSPGSTGSASTAPPGSTSPPPTVPSSTATPPTTATTVPSTAAPATSTTTTHAVGAAGTVTVSVRAGVLSVTAVQPAAGWTYATEHESGDEVELSFRNAATGDEASFRARLEDDGLRVETEDDGPDD